MKNKTLIVAPLELSTGAMAEFYNAYADELQKHEIDLLSVNIYGNSSNEILFDRAVKVESYKVKTRREKYFTLLFKFYLQRIWTYAEMQELGANGRKKIRSFCTLIKFEKVLEQYIDQENVKHILLNHQFSGFHLVARDLCIRKNIPFHYWHPGLLPGTMCIDKEGQMAESEINAALATTTGVFQEQDYEVGNQYIDWAIKSGFKRPGKKPKSDPDEWEQIQDELKSEMKPVILVIGSNDYRTGIAPRQYVHARLHSAFYGSSVDFLLDIVKEIDERAHIMFKPHPNILNQISVPDNVTLVKNVTISDLLDITDVTATIVSSSGYESLLKGVPCVVAGNIPGSKLGLFHSLKEDSNSLSELLLEAASEGVSEERKKIFTGFCGFMLRNYFFSFGSYSYPYLTKNIQDAVKEIVESVHRVS